MSTVPAFASASEAMDMVHAGLGYLAATDPAAMPADTQARCLQMLEQATAMGTAARAPILAAEIYARSLPEDPGKDRDQGFEDRSVTLATTFGGAGVLSGDLSPECAAVVTAVLDALSAPAGAEDDRSQAQRYHDALQQAMQRLVTAGLLPERAGQPVKALVHVSLADLLLLEGSSALLEEWSSRVRARWAAHRAAASAGGSDGGTPEARRSSCPRVPSSSGD